MPRPAVVVHVNKTWSCMNYKTAQAGQPSFQLKMLATLVADQLAKPLENLRSNIKPVMADLREGLKPIWHDAQPVVDSAIEKLKPEIRPAAAELGKSVARALKPELVGIVDDLGAAGIGGAAGYGIGELVSSMYKQPDVTKLDLRRPDTVRKFYNDYERAKRRRSATRLILASLGGIGARAAYKKWGPGETAMGKKAQAYPRDNMVIQHSTNGVPSAFVAGKAEYPTFKANLAQFLNDSQGMKSAPGKPGEAVVDFDALRANKADFMSKLHEMALKPGEADKFIKDYNITGPDGKLATTSDILGAWPVRVMDHNGNFSVTFGVGRGANAPAVASRVANYRRLADAFNGNGNGNGNVNGNATTGGKSSVAAIRPNSAASTPN